MLKDKKKQKKVILALIAVLAIGAVGAYGISQSVKHENTKKAMTKIEKSKEEKKKAEKSEAKEKTEEEKAKEELEKAKKSGDKEAIKAAEAKVTATKTTSSNSSSSGSSSSSSGSSTPQKKKVWVVDKPAWTETVEVPVTKYRKYWWVSYSDGSIKNFYNYEEWRLAWKGEDGLGVSGVSSYGGPKQESYTEYETRTIQHPEEGHTEYR